MDHMCYSLLHNRNMVLCQLALLALDLALLALPVLLVLVHIVGYVKWVCIHSRIFLVPLGHDSSIKAVLVHTSCYGAYQYNRNQVLLVP